MYIMKKVSLKSAMWVVLYPLRLRLLREVSLLNAMYANSEKFVPQSMFQMYLLKPILKYSVGRKVMMWMEKRLRCRLIYKQNISNVKKIISNTMTSDVLRRVNELQHYLNDNLPKPFNPLNNS